MSSDSGRNRDHPRPASRGAAAGAAPLLPELTRSLRALGVESDEASVPGLQARYFTPLLAAKRRAEELDSAVEVARELDGARLRREIHAVVVSIAEQRSRGVAPVRRATEALLLEAIDPLFSALDRLSGAAALTEDGALRESWLSEVRAVFRAADDGWTALRAALADAPSPEPEDAGRGWWPAAGGERRPGSDR
jgi:hypothetical protein